MFASLFAWLVVAHLAADYPLNPAEGVSTSQGVSVRERGRRARAVDAKNCVSRMCCVGPLPEDALLRVNPCDVSGSFLAR